MGGRARAPSQKNRDHKEEERSKKVLPLADDVQMASQSAVAGLVESNTKIVGRRKQD